MFQFRAQIDRFTLLVSAVAVGATLLSFWAPSAAPRFDGLLGRYFATPDWSGDPVIERIDPAITTDTLAATRELAGLEQFSVEWTGSLVIRRDGIYRFATKSDDGTWLWIGEELVIDNGGSHAIRNEQGDLHLRRGLYPVKLRYNQTGGGYFVQVGQFGPSGAVHPGPLMPENLTYARLRTRELWPLALVAIWYVTLGSLLLNVLRHARALAIFRDLAEAWSDRWIRVIVVLGAVSCVAHIAYGLPAIPSFSGDELEPIDVLVASETAFRDWNLRWPPLHAFFIAGVLQPFAWARALFDLTITDHVVTGCMYVVARSLSVLLVALSLLLTIDGVRSIAGRRSGYFAGVLLGCSPLVVFFGSFSNLEIPHLFWVTVTFWTWLKLLRYGHAYWFAAFGAAVGFSLAAKDQAYGYYVAAPFALIFFVGRERRARSLRKWLRALGDRRLVYAAVAACLAMALGHALPWRYDRFLARFAVMTGPASVPYQMFPPTLEGHAALLSATARSFVWGAGVPLTVAFVGGVWEFVRNGSTWRLLTMSTPLLTYYASFLAVILYVYDRFLIGWVPIAAAIGGVFLAKMLRVGPRTVGGLVVFLIVSAGILNAVAVNAVFYRDPRHAAWRWLQQNVPCGSSIGVVYEARYVPPLDCYDMWALVPRTAERLVRWPTYLVTNEAFLQRFNWTPSGASFLERLHSQQLGYRRILRVESIPPWWAPLYWEQRFWNRRDDPETTADKPLSAIEVWERVGPDAPPSSAHSANADSLR